MVGAYDFDTDECCVDVALVNRRTGAAFVTPCTVHHRDGVIRHIAFPSFWAQNVRLSGIDDPHTALGERYLMLAARWKFRQVYGAERPFALVRVVNATRCLVDYIENGIVAAEARKQLADLDAALARANAEVLRESGAA